MTTLQKLTERIQELCPELLELSFGCIVEFDNEKYRFVRVYGDGVLNAFQFCKLDDSDVTLGIMEHSPEHFKIIGHPITLEHCRLALRRAGFEFANGNPIGMLDARWEDLQPWESQTAVHEFLSQYLLNEKDEK